MGRAQNIAQRQLAWSAQERLRHLERLAYWRGTVRRADLMDRFGISVQMASADIKAYLTRNPGALQYDSKRRLYVATTKMLPVMHEPKFEEAFFTAPYRSPDAGPWFDRLVLPQREFKPACARAVFRAAVSHLAIRIRYASMNSATFRWRWITPHAFAHDGLRWHARAFCHDTNEYKDFVLGRIAAVGVTKPSSTSAVDDREWASSSVVELTPDPTLSSAEVKALALDYNISSNRLRVTVRRSLAPYLLTQMGIESPRGRRQRRFKVIGTAPTR